MTTPLLRASGALPDQQPSGAAAAMPLAMKRDNVRFALALPLFFMIAFPLCYVTALHAPVPHEVPVAVVGAGAAALVAALGPRLGDAVDLVPVGSVDQAREMILAQTAKAAYVPAGPGDTARMLLAGADGRVMTALVPAIFSPVAAAQGATLQTVDIAPLAAGDANGIGLMFFMLIVALLGFMAANILGNAAFFLSLRVRLGVLGAIAVVGPLVVWAFMGPWLHMVVGSPGEIAAVVVLAMVVSFTVATATTAAVTLIGKWAIFPAMLLFVFLNIPSSNAAYPAEIVPPFFGWLSEWHLGAALVDAARSILYLGGVGLTEHVVIIAIWLVAAVGLLVGAVAYQRRREARSEESEGSEGSGQDEGSGEDAGRVDEERHEAAAAAAGAGPGHPLGHLLRGRVTGGTGRALPDVRVTLIDEGGTQSGLAGTDGDGRFTLTDVSGGSYTLVVSARGHRPEVRPARVDDVRGAEHDLGVVTLVPHAAGERPETQGAATLASGSHASA